MSNADGKIQGFDWSVNLDSEDDEQQLNGFVRRKGWTVRTDGGGSSVDGKEGDETVTIVTGGRKGRNGFFFPGFIGMF